MVQHLNWYVVVPPSHGTTFKLVRQRNTQPWYNIRPGTSVYHSIMVQLFDLVRQRTTQPWYNI